MSTAPVITAPDATVPAITASIPVAPPPVSAAKPKPPVAIATMETIVTRDALLMEIAAAQGITSTKTTIPILTNFLIEASDGALSITASNLEQTLRTRVRAVVKKPGTATVPAKKFLDYIKLLPSGDISIKLLENFWVQINAGRSRTKMVGMARDNFPKVPTPPKSKPIIIPVYLLRSLIAHTIDAVSTEQTRYTLNAALLLLESTKISMVATDGHRLALAEKSEDLVGVTTARKILIPAKALYDLTSLLGSTDVDAVELFEDESMIFFRLGHREFSTRKTTGAFPNYTAVIPIGNLNSVVVHTPEFEKSVRRVSQFADEKSNALKLNLGGNALKINTSSVESGESEDTIDAAYKGAPVSIKLNSAYILDFCKAIGGAGEVKLSFKDGTSAAMFEPEDINRELRYKCVIMPMR